MLVEERVRQSSLQRVSKPAIDDVGGEGALFSLENRRWQILLADSPMEPFAGPTAYLHRRRQALGELDDGAIEVGDANLETVRHRELVAEHQELVRKRRSDLEVLKSSDLVEVHHLREEGGPVFRDTAVARGG